MANKFYVEGMTVEQILSMNPREMSKLNTREISRALRTVSLAANKRINRLKQYAKKEKTGYVPKGVKTQIATDALNWVTKDGKVKMPFGVKSAGTRNKMLNQISTIKQFMSMKSSTVTGATALRKEREKKLYGKTREQAARGQTKRQKAATYKHFQEMNARVWDLYYNFMNLQKMDPHSVWYGSDEILEIIGHGVASANSEEEIITEALNRVKEATEAQQEEHDQLFGDDWNDFGNFEF